MSHACGQSCNGCGDQRISLGLDTRDFKHVIALAGNPNTGKSTVFNALTGLRQHTGNWPGKTVTRAEGAFSVQDVRYKLVDLPGTYSLLSASSDEQVARDFLLFAQPDCVVVVVDATSLERNLNLVFQVMEITPKMVVCVNLMDEARRKGIDVDLDCLAERLGVPVVGTAARRGTGISRLIEVVADVVNGRIVARPNVVPTPDALQKEVNAVVPLVLALAPELPNARWVAYRLIEGDHRVREALRSGELARLAKQSEATGDQAMERSETNRVLEKTL